MSNRVLTKKISAMLSVMLLVSMLVPVLAFAATGFSNLVYKNGTVSGTVYSSVYTGVKDAVYLNVYSPSNALVTTTTATYSTYANGNYYYDFSKYFSNEFNYVTVYADVYQNGTVGESVYQTVYNTTDKSTSGRSSRGSSGSAAPISTNNSIQAESNGNVDATALKNALAASKNVEIKISGEIAIIPASALVDALKDGAVITVVSDNGSYSLPLSVLDLDALTKELDVTVDVLNIKVSIKKLSDDAAKAVADAAASLGANQVSDVVDFNVVAEGKDGKTANIKFGNTYVSRSVKLSKSVDSSKATGVLYNEATNKLSFVPAVFGTKDDQPIATLKRNGNSIYTVVELNKSFDDIASHWAKADIELLANKLVVDGVSDNKFDADRNITRAEFAALVVRALGLSTVSAASDFTDVKSGAWYADAVAAAAQAGIINGYEDKTFRPDAQITREELAAMAVRAMSYADIATTVSADDQASLLKKFKDADDIVWAKAEIAAAINAGLINGLTDTTLGPDSQATRAQTATILKRFLSTANFIN
ncbi:S-layer homology domain-containing protein [Paenibacillus hamazuiensis]|uniref:S-layer homology domain-containing protein n=1 Tax=Paenibacillus hamazuiensis TaxID=2936508 RepID=UPI00200BD691